MRATRPALMSLAGAAALLAPAAAAHAEEPGTLTSFSFSVSPSTVAPGGTVALTATGCPAKKATVSSDVFDTVTVHDGRPTEARVDKAAEPGAEYEVTFDCKGEKGRASLTVTPGSGTGTGTGTSTSPSTGPGTDSGTGGDHHQAPVKPGGGAHAGTGGSYSGFGPVQAGAGWALVAGALGGGVYLLLRRRPGERA